MIVKWRHNVATTESSLTFNSNFLCLCEAASTYVPLSLYYIWLLLWSLLFLCDWTKDCRGKQPAQRTLWRAMMPLWTLQRAPINISHGSKLFFAAVHLSRSTVIFGDFSDFLKHLSMFECQQFSDSLLVALFLKALLIDCRFLELKWPLLSEPPQYETQGLLKSDVTFVETLCSQPACQEGSNVTILNPFSTHFYSFPIPLFTFCFVPLAWVWWKYILNYQHN